MDKIINFPVPKPKDIFEGIYDFQTGLRIDFKGGSPVFNYSVNCSQDEHLNPERYVWDFGLKDVIVEGVRVCAEELSPTARAELVFNGVSAYYPCGPRI